MRNLIFNIAALFFFSSLFASCDKTEVEELANELDEEYLSLSPLDRILYDAGTEWLDKLCCKDFAGRRVGTEGNRLAFEYIINELETMGYNPESQVFNIENGTVLHNIIVKVPGCSDSTVIVGAHFDGARQSTGRNHYQAANDNASGVVSLLLLLKYLKSDFIELDKSVVCCFWDGEENYEGNVFQGSSFYAKQLSEQFKSLVLYYVNLDTIGHEHDNDNNGLDDIYLDCYGSEQIKLIATITSNNGYFDYIVLPRITYSSDYVSFYRIGIPFIWYHDHNDRICDNPIHSTADCKDVISIKRLIKIAKIVHGYLITYSDL